ncbi:ABC-type multidrug transport system ATPase subunit [Motilibacter peucedani]|uniref:ABC-type multidrug transport system ATPase subunit n=1 Tax=Motilibacter peucedani TaxID=598650 RepID=A0A420XVC7_9ACTN|nr:ABC transporter ATP-binding protein [Motilibacter peucedani]RKS80727.1 ABC-type multidrug transport system ATPase subunit [Motilibacter peucedani]
MTALLELRGVSRTYGARQALHPIDLDLDAGGCVALVGENGSGKSTLLRIACGREVPTTGTVQLEGRAVVESDPHVRARVAVVADAPSFYPDLTVREHLRLVAVANGVGRDADEWIDWALEDRRLGDHADAYPSTLSSGQVQALLLAAALVRPRDVLVLDEPEQRLDPGARDRLAERLAAERADGVAVLLATHSRELAEAVADRTVRLQDGRVVG